MNITNKKRYLSPSLMKNTSWQPLSSEPKYNSANGILLMTLILNADNEGREKINSANIKSSLFIFKKEWNNENSVKEMLENIHKLSNKITFYRQSDDIFYQINNWEKTPQILGRIYREKSTFPVLTKNNKICQKINLFGEQIESNQTQINKKTESNQAQPEKLRPEQIGSRPYNKNNPAFIRGPGGQRMKLC